MEGPVSSLTACMFKRFRVVVLFFCSSVYVQWILKVAALQQLKQARTCRWWLFKVSL